MPISIDADKAEGGPPFDTRRGRRQGALGLLLFAVAESLACTLGDSGSIHFVTNASAKPPKKPPVPCSSDGQCPPPMPYCDAVSRTCIQCLADPNCSGPKRFCGPHGFCVECVVDEGCDKGKPFCDLERLSCIECFSDAHCAPGKVCHPTSGRCVPTCVDSRDCGSMTPYCDTARRLCVQCIADTNCPDPRKSACAAAMGDCVECTSNAQCDEAHPICNMLTYECEG